MKIGILGSSEEISASRSRRKTSGLLALLLGAFCACGAVTTAPGVGAEGGGCSPGDTCNAGLACFSRICVRYDGGARRDSGGGSGGGSAACDAAGVGGLYQPPAP